MPLGQEWFLCNQGLLPGSLATVYGNRDDLQTLVFVVGISGFEVGYLLTTGDTPTGPEVDEQILLAFRDSLTLLALAFDIGKREARVGLSDKRLGVDLRVEELSIEAVLGTVGELVPVRLAVRREVIVEVEHGEGSPPRVLVVGGYPLIGSFHGGEEELLKSCKDGIVGCWLVHSFVVVVIHTVQGLVPASYPKLILSLQRAARDQDVFALVPGDTIVFLLADLNVDERFLSFPVIGLRK